jgi:hypothetical protein
MCSEICFLSFQNRDFLRKTSPSLLIKFLHKIFNMENMPWVHLIWRSYNNPSPQATNISSSFRWRGIVKLCSKFKSFASCSIASSDIQQDTGTSSRTLRLSQGGVEATLQAQRRHGEAGVARRRHDRERQCLPRFRALVVR